MEALPTQFSALAREMYLRTIPILILESFLLEA